MGTCLTCLGRLCETEEERMEREAKQIDRVVRRFFSHLDDSEREFYRYMDKELLSTVR